MAAMNDRFSRKGAPAGGGEGFGEEVSRHHNAIIGLERRLAGGGGDVGVVRMALMRHYAAFAVGVVRRMGGDVRGLRELTDRNNIVPLAGRLSDDRLQV